ncbi:MAG: P1 family peptidase [Anaerolineaceae bacterium]|nr:P1 family peptidase [Anaerolineaceae bacterium]
MKSITDIPGIKVGHAQDENALTGCTVILTEDGAISGVDQRGGAPGTRETDLLRTSHLVQKIHGILLTGGSAFGLDAVSGVMRYLEENKIGYNTGSIKVPIVPAAVIFDLALGDPTVRPGTQMGYEACKNASDLPPLEGNVGAGTGASVGKIFGMAGAMKSGIGTAAMELGGGVIVGAICVVNAFGDVVDYKTSKLIAGARSLKKGPLKLGKGPFFANTLEVLTTFYGRKILQLASLSNTVIGVVATNAKLTKEEVNKVAQMAGNGITLSIQPANTMLDGDTIFALSTQKKRANVNIVGSYAAIVVAEAIVRATRLAVGAGGLPAHVDISRKLSLHSS